MDKHEELSLNIPESGKKRLVIIGGGFGGLNLVKHLKKDMFQVVLLDRYNYHTFQPLLYQVATAGLEPDSVAGPLRKMIKRKKDFHFRMLTVHRIDPEQQLIHTVAGELKYDYLVVASGSKINYFGNQDISENGFPLKQVTHALDLRSKILQQFENLELLNEHDGMQRYFNFVVVGAGPTGVELCGALAELRNHVLPADYPELSFERMKIHLVEGLDRVLPAMSRQAGKKAHRYLEGMGVEIILNTLTESYDGETVLLNNGNKIETNTLIWAAGVKGNVIEGLKKENQAKGRIKVDQFNRVYRDREEKFPNLFAIGDVAFMETEKHPEGLPGLAPVAIQQGKHLARNLERLHRQKNPEPFRYRNKGVLATIGRNRAVADMPGGLKLGGFAGWVVWVTAHLFFLVGFRNKAVVFTNWIWNYFTYDRGIRLIIRPPGKGKDLISREVASEADNPHT